MCKTCNAEVKFVVRFELREMSDSQIAMALPNNYVRMPELRSATHSLCPCALLALLVSFQSTIVFSKLFVALAIHTLKN